jgi:hypothetical protein
MISLPLTGSGALLEKLSPFVDDRFLNEVIPRRRGPGRPRAFSSAQLFRVLLLSLLTPAHSFNLLLALLPENRAWRKFARLPNQRLLPDAKMLHQFRGRLDLPVLRQINARLLRPLLAELDPLRRSVAIIDSTDLPAAANSFKKTNPIPRARPQWAPARSKRAKANGSSVTRSTPCACGWRHALTPFC